MVTVGQEHLAVAAVLDPDDASLGQLTHRPVHRVHRATQPPGQGRAGRHPAAGGVAVAQQQRVQPERGVVDVGVDHPLRDDREPRLLDDQGVGVADRGGDIWGDITNLSERETKGGHAASTPGHAGASGMRQEMQRNCTETAAQTTEPAHGCEDVYAGHSHISLIWHAANKPACLLRIRRLGVRIPPGAPLLRVVTRPLTSANAAGAASFPTARGRPGRPVVPKKVPRIPRRRPPSDGVTLRLFEGPSSRR